MKILTLIWLVSKDNVSPQIDMDFYGRNINWKESKQIVQVEDYGKILIVGWLKPPYVTILVMENVRLVGGCLYLVHLEV